jgi:hypothetical protein
VLATTDIYGCVDLALNCATLAAQQFCQNQVYLQTMIENCKLTCRYCNPNNVPQPNPNPIGQPTPYPYGYPYYPNPQYPPYYPNPQYPNPQYPNPQYPNPQNPIPNVGANCVDKSDK